MDPFNDKASEFERRASLRRSFRLSVGETGGIPEDDDDEYDLAAAMISDGFRPETHVPTHSSAQLDTPSSNTSPLSSQSTPDSPSQTQLPNNTDDDSSKTSATTTDRPSSVYKNSRAHDSLTLQHDGPNSMATSPIQSSTLPQLRPQSPYRGPSGPSHPYQMYLQRTLSNATSSTGNGNTRRSYDGQQGPTHPYGLYTQNTMSSEEENPQPQIQVGFNNNGDTYRRQLGPDGEEAGGLIGPMGHTEELPPYTRYPNTEFAAKTAAEEGQTATATETATATPTTTVTTVATTSSSTAAMAATTVVAAVAETTAVTTAASTRTMTSSPELIAGAGGIGVATRNPEFSATEEDLEPTTSRPSTASHHDINTAARGMAGEKTEEMNKWQRRAKKKLWGIIPYWAICLLAVGIVLMGVIMGAVIGTVLSHGKHHGYPHAFPGGGPGSSPSGAPVDVVPLSSIPAGLPALDTGAFALPQLIANQSPKSCLNDSNQSQAWTCDMPCRYFSVNISQIAHPKSESQSYQFMLTSVNSTDSKFLWGTQPPQILEPTILTLVNDSFNQGYGPAWWLRLVYDKTVLLRPGSFPTPTEKRWEFPPSSLTDFGSPEGKEGVTATDGSEPWVCTWPDTTFEVFIYPRENVSQPSRSFTLTTSAALPIATGPVSGNTPPVDSLQPYPKAIKFVEYRSFNPASRPYCQLVKITNNGYGMANVTDHSGKPIEIDLSEAENTWQGQWRGGSRGRSPVDRSLTTRGPYKISRCGCLWWSI